MPIHQGQCHCGAVQFEFTGPTITQGIRCNCSICRAKGILMSDFSVSPEALKIQAKDGVLGVYEFGTHTAKHYFCKTCGVYPFHQMFSKPGQYRFNLGCIEGLDSLSLPHSLFDGAAF